VLWQRLQRFRLWETFLQAAQQLLPFIDLFEASEDSKVKCGLSL
jgi:hypothetical protein